MPNGRGIDGDTDTGGVGGGGGSGLGSSYGADVGAGANSGGGSGTGAHAGSNSGDFYFFGVPYGSGALRQPPPSVSSIFSAPIFTLVLYCIINYGCCVMSFRN